MLPKNRSPLHPGELLQELFIDEMGLSQTALAEHLELPPQRINEIVNGKRSISARMAWLLAGALGTTPQFWMNAQANFDLANNQPTESVEKLKVAKK